MNIQDPEVVQRRRPLLRLGTRVAIAAAMVASTCWMSGAALAWCFGASSPFALRKPARAPLSQRRFFGDLLDPSVWERDSFVADSMSPWLPSYPPRTEVVALEVEPSSGRYLSFLRPENCKWYMEKVVIVGENLGELDGRTLEVMKRTASEMGAGFEALPWKKAGVPPQIKLGSVDIGLMSDGACAKLGAKGTEAALRRMFLMLKNSGRFFIIANSDDEQIGFREQLVLGFEPAVLKKIGWQIQAAKRDNGVVVGTSTSHIAAMGASLHNLLKDWRYEKTTKDYQAVRRDMPNRINLQTCVLVRWRGRTPAAAQGIEFRGMRDRGSASGAPSAPWYGPSFCINCETNDMRHVSRKLLIIWSRECLVERCSTMLCRDCCASLGYLSRVMHMPLRYPLMLRLSAAYRDILCTGSELMQLVQAVAADTLGVPTSDLPLAAPLGVDSATAVRFSDALEKELKADLAGKRLPSTLAFDFPTLTELVEGLPQLIAGRSQSSDTSIHSGKQGWGADEPKATRSSNLLISAFSCELPGASDLQELWSRLEAEVDDVQEVPVCRWDWADAENAEACARHGSFVEGADLFDGTFFGLQPAEAQATDPQQRLLLRTSYKALAGSGHDKGTLLGAPHGVFAAVSNQEKPEQAWQSRDLTYIAYGVWKTPTTSTGLAYMVIQRGSSWCFHRPTFRGSRMRNCIMCCGHLLYCQLPSAMQALESLQRWPRTAYPFPWVFVGPA
ncbi:eryA [Symbiodinium natans]|uniref:EryA protein n=1 Tax=Symbiodinium natans TaxID=878477 RepID=A0A812R276_9DINO|nr:eryA [Symbiodinium natans]